MTIPKDFSKVAHRYDQYKRVECTVYFGRSEDFQGMYFLEVNKKVVGPLSIAEIEVIMDCLKNDIDLTKRR